MAVLYVVAAWLIMQVAEVLMDLANLPDWIGPAVLALLAVGFPIALVVSWLYEITPEGLSLEKDVDRAESITHVTGRRIDFIVISLLSAAVLLFAWHTWWPQEQSERSIAVLPFVNLSTDEGTQYFSDGLTEELINMLARIPGFRISARTSSSVFKNSSAKVTAIADDLDVAYVLEGSVRKSDDQLRITAQLIDATDGLQVWSNAWDKSLTDVIQIQSEIAKAVVSSLRVAFPEPFPSVGTTNPEAFDLYLRGRDANGIGTAEAYQAGERQLVRALAIDPEFAEAWAFLGVIYTNQGHNMMVAPAEAAVQARASFERALSIDPVNPRARAGLANRAMFDWDFVEAGRQIKRAYDTAPGHISVLNTYASWAAGFGRFEQAAELYRRAIASRPAAVIVRSNYVVLLIDSNRLDEAAAQLEEMRQIDPESDFNLADAGLLALRSGNGERALELFLESTGTRRDLWLALAYHSLGLDDDAGAALENFINKAAPASFYVASFYAYQRKTDEAFQWLELAYYERSPEMRLLRRSWLFEHLHDDPRWTELLVRLGLDDQSFARIEP
jgi:TolB-like protein/Tfp pilus assembly protein PilF